MSLENVDKHFLACVADPRHLELIVLPTEKCNFRCTYCYEDFAIGRMKPEIVSALTAWIERRAPELKSLSISWFGGEPTLVLPIVHDICRSSRDALSRSREPNPRFSSAMTTNGYRLNWHTFSGLVNAGVTDYQITLDGPREIHDKRRLRCDGNGTFDAIWNNLRTIANRAHELSSSFEILLRLHFDRTSAHELESLVDEICRELIPSGAFRVHFHQIEALGGPNDSQLDPPGDIELELVRSLDRRISKEFGASSSHVASDVEGVVCYAAKANSFVVRADGRIGKCTVALSDPRNDVGQLNMDGTVMWFQGRMEPWLRGIATNNSRIMACPFADMPAAVELSV